MADRPAPLGASDKLAFLLSLVPYLIDQVRVTVAEAAEHFGTTPEQMRRAVTLIATSGTPGADGMYTHETLFDIDWDDFEQRDLIRFRAAPLEDRPRFSAREAAALLAGLQRVAALPEFASRVDVVELMGKLARGASDTPSAIALRTAEQHDIHTTLVTAVTAGRRVRIDYVSTRGERQIREVDPFRVDGVDEAWYLRGWCLTRDAERTFLLDRIASVEVLGPVDHRSLDTPADPIVAGIPDGDRVELALAVTAVPLIADYLSPDDTVSVEGDRATVSLRVAHDGILGRIAARVAGSIEVVGPQSARAAVAEWARAAIAAQTDASTQETPNRDR